MAKVAIEKVAQSAYEMASELADQAARSLAERVDLELAWSWKVGDYWGEAERLNEAHGLSPHDGRTRGGRYLKAKKQEFIREWKRA